MYFWLVFAFFNIIQWISARYSHIIEKKLWKKLSLIMLFIITSFCYVLMWNIIFIFSFIFVFLFQFVKWFSSIVISDYIHKETKSDIRATILSLQTQRALAAGFLALITLLQPSATTPSAETRRPAAAGFIASIILVQPSAIPSLLSIAVAKLLGVMEAVILSLPAATSTATLGATG